MIYVFEHSFIEIYQLKKLKIMARKDVNTASWQIKVTIKSNLMKTLPFQFILSRLPTATILAYTGYMREVVFLL